MTRKLLLLKLYITPKLVSKSEKRHLRERKKFLKKRRKNYVRQEKASSLKQKRELKKIIRQRNRNSIYKFFSAFLNLFKFERSKNVKQNKQSFRMGIARRLKMQFQDLKRARMERKKIRHRRKETRKKSKQFLRDQKRSIQKERVHMRKKSDPLRQRIRTDRIKHWKRNFYESLKKPFKRKKVDERDKIFKKHVKEDIKYYRRQSILGFPALVSSKIRAYFRMRREKMEFARMALTESYYNLSSATNISTNKRDFIFTSINSLLSFLLAFWLMYYLSQMASILAAHLYEVPAVLHSYRIFWPLYTYSTLYTRKALIIMFGIGPLAALILGFICYHIFIRVRTFNSYLKSLIIWLVFHGVNMFFGAYIIGFITRTGFIYSTEWIFYSNVFDIEEIIFLIISIVAMIIFGFFSTRQFLFATTVSNIIEPKIRIVYIFGQIVIPWFLGFMIIYISNLPNNPPELVLQYVISFLMVIPVLFNYNMPSNRYLEFPVPPSGVKFAWIFLTMVLVVLVVIRLYVFPGINFN